MGRTLTIRNRETGEVGTVMDLDGMSERQVDRMWRGLCYQVDFEHWEPVWSEGEDR